MVVKKSDFWSISKNFEHHGMVTEGYVNVRSLFRTTVVYVL